MSDFPELNIEVLKKEALKVAQLSPCRKRKVGAVIVGEYGTIATGYNHNPTRDEECEDENGHTKLSTKHAEIAALEGFSNKIALSAPEDVHSIFVTHPPCNNCKQAILNAGIKEEHIYIVDDFMKFDSGKLRYGLIPPEATKALAEVLTYGAKKYKPNNWKNGEPDRYVDALYRHLEAWRAGESHDDESGLPHLSHALTNVAFLLWFEEQNR